MKLVALNSFYTKHEVCTQQVQFVVIMELSAPSNTIALIVALPVENIQSFVLNKPLPTQFSQPHLALTILIFNNWWRNSRLDRVAYIDDNFPGVVG